MDNIRVWGIGTLRTIRVHWMLAEFGLKYQYYPIRARTGEANNEEYRRLNPLEKIPTLRDDSVTVTESAAIVFYLYRNYKKPSQFYMPQDSSEFARVDSWSYFIMTELDANSIYTLRRHDVPPLGLSEIYGASPIAVKAAKEYFLKQINAMSNVLNLGGDYLMGNKVSVPDLLMVSALDAAIMFDIDLPDLWQAYRERLIARPAYQKARLTNSYEFNEGRDANISYAVET